MAPGDWKPAASLEPEKVAESKLTPGLDYKYFEGNWKMLPDFGKLEAKKTGVVEDIGLSIQDQRDNFGIVFSGYLKIAEEGEYIFSIRSDDGTRVILAGKEIILNDGIHDMIPVSSQPVLLAPDSTRSGLITSKPAGERGSRSASIPQPMASGTAFQNRCFTAAKAVPESPNRVGQRS